MRRDTRIMELERDGVLQAADKFETTDSPNSFYFLIAQFALDKLTAKGRVHWA